VCHRDVDRDNVAFLLSLMWISVISGFCRDVNEICALLEDGADGITTVRCIQLQNSAHLNMDTLNVTLLQRGLLVTSNCCILS